MVTYIFISGTCLSIVSAPGFFLDKKTKAIKQTNKQTNSTWLLELGNLRCKVMPVFKRKTNCFHLILSFSTSLVLTEELMDNLGVSVAVATEVFPLTFLQNCNTVHLAPPQNPWFVRRFTKNSVCLLIYSCHLQLVFS